ncbi:MULTISPECIES: hypothetical protein [Psychrilyobacter]|uniref:DUF5666 domain-containing protein n=1 Tax=Psychrilyobacter piezotolerans TaxID=2293438 RepID=A0ABX9KGW0_9FUSO|nr:MULTISPECIES: hypothetical protein [Psychrilyobacter]MCS5422361.1 hypothetical protein [Psychrilyobacter sp. S5]NDI78046.1 hypothetical protein [Psychrilyobacter piezotolerans]RDE61982.1 hypothetical protein DV867_08310 [Psychrilyobacter sp. S5]REI41208.1 hypothetical protein DYH56_08310 [Psychrilyobacter piezotolerans]
MKKIITILFLMMGLVSYSGEAKLIIPRGTPLMIKTIDTIDGSRHNAGHKFSAILEGDVVIGNKVAIKSGSKVYGTVVESVQASRLVGSSKLSIKLTQVMVDNRLVYITTNQLNYIGKQGSGADTAGKTARAVAVGGLIDGSSGAKTGAKVGLGVSVLTKGGTIGIPSGTYLDFTFDQDVVL